MADDTVTIEVNGQALSARKGQMLIEVTDAAGVWVPRFCYHKKLTVAANCRMCLVEVERAPKPLPACATPVMDGMKVFTKSPLALEAQRSVMEFLLINHPLDCPICDQGGECELQDISMGFGRGVSRFTERKRVVDDEDLGPLVSTDMTRCIHCTRCVRFGEEIGGMPELGATGRSEHMRIGTYLRLGVDSEMSGNVIDLCPVGALTSKPFRFRARAWEMIQRPSIAPHDAVGSNIDVHVRRNRVMRVVPRENEAVNETWISDRDRFSYEGLYAADRIAAPWIKRDGEWREVEWEDALEFVAEGLRAAAGDGGLGTLVSPSATLEEMFLAQKLARGLGSPNVDHRLRRVDFSDQDSAPAYPSLGLAIADLERLDAALLVGSNARKEHPIVNHRLRKASRAGAAICALSPVDWDLNFRAAERLIAAPSALPRALAEIAAALVADGADPGDARKLLAGVKPGDEARAIAGRLAAGERAAVLLGPGAIEHPQAAALRALAGLVARLAGASAGELAEGANAAGGWLAGAVPHRGPGGAPAREAGLDARAMVEAGLAGYLLVGVEPELDCADSAAALAAMRGARFVVSLGPYRGEGVSEYADACLPACPFTETSGTYVNAEGAWQSFAAVVAPLGLARPAWRVLRVLGNVLDLDGFEYDSSDAIREAVRAAAESAPAAPAAEALPRSIPAPGWDGGAERVGGAPIHAVDALVRRSAPLQHTRDAAAPGVAVHPDLAARLGVADGGAVRVRQNGAALTLDLVCDPRVADGAAWLPSGIGASLGLGPAFGPLEIEKA